MPIGLSFIVEDIPDTALIVRPIHVSAAHTVTIGTVFFCDASGGAFTITLPPASDNESRVLIFIKTDSSANVVTVSRQGSDTIVGGTTHALNAQYNYVVLVNDEELANIWYIISSG